MIEVKSKFSTNRLFANRTWFSDLFKLVVYFGYKDDIENVPFWYFKYKGNSCVTNLTKSMNEIVAAMKSNTRNEIRRSEREGCLFEIVGTFDEFIPLYNDFCKAKGLADFVDRTRMLKYEKLLITKAVQNGQVMAMHSNILDEESRISLLQFSCSPRLLKGVDKKMIGWANRFLHYKDLEWLKDHGYETYDWSGVVVDPEDPRYSIGQFKMSFGGELIDSWTLRTPLYAFAEWVRGKLRK
jgi:lipid II:glycine glycyltransferase (peptidoglycan interpeptide bridge formation enzyme)